MPQAVIVRTVSGSVCDRKHILVTTPLCSGMVRHASPTVCENLPPAAFHSYEGRGIGERTKDFEPKTLSDAMKETDLDLAMNRRVDEHRKDLYKHKSIDRQEYCHEPER